MTGGMWWMLTIGVALGFGLGTVFSALLVRWLAGGR